MRRMNAASIGEMPPSTRNSAGFSTDTASAASVTMSAKVRHSGSTSNAQCDLLLGSFQNITASIIKRRAGCGSGGREHATRQHAERRLVSGALLGKESEGFA